MKYVILTNGNDFCTKTLSFLEGKLGGERINILVEIPYRLIDYRRKDEQLSVVVFIKLFYRLIVRMRFVTIFLMRNTRHLLKVRFIGRVNSNRTVNSIEKYKIDVVFLAGMSILTRSFLNKIRVGVYNCHPGLVPHVRGVDVIYHAVVNSIPPIISIHRVDEGIDTGQMIQGFKVPVNMLNINGSYEEICDDVLNYGAEKFADFIMDYINLKEEVAKISCPLDFPVLKYCHKEMNKDYNLFHRELKNLY